MSACLDMYQQPTDVRNMLRILISTLKYKIHNMLQALLSFIVLVYFNFEIKLRNMLLSSWCADTGSRPWGRVGISKTRSLDSQPPAVLFLAPSAVTLCCEPLAKSLPKQGGAPRPSVPRASRAGGALFLRRHFAQRGSLAAGSNTRHSGLGRALSVFVTKLRAPREDTGPPPSLSPPPPRCGSKPTIEIAINAAIEADNGNR